MTDSSPGRTEESADKSSTGNEVDTGVNKVKPEEQSKTSAFSYLLDGSVSPPLLYTNGIQFQIKDSHKKGPSCAYASLPGVQSTPFDWKMCCDRGDDVGSEHVTYYQLRDTDKSLQDILSDCSYSVIGLIIINNSNHPLLSDDIVKNGIPQSLPMYIVSSQDGKDLISYVQRHGEGSVQVKIVVGNGFALSESMFDRDNQRLLLDSPRMDIHKISKPTVLKNGIKSIFKRKRGSIHVVSGSPSDIQTLMSFFHTYENNHREEQPEKAINTLRKVSKDTFNKDFLTYLLIAYRFTTRDVYGDGPNTSGFMFALECKDEFESLNDVQSIADTMLSFVSREDFLIPWYHDSQDSDEYAFHLLSCMAKEWMKRSDLSRGEWTKEKSPTIIYQRLLWTSVFIFFGYHTNKPDSTLNRVWNEFFANEIVQSRVTFSDKVLKEFSKGIKFMEALKIPPKFRLDSSTLAEFLNPQLVKTLRFSHITKLLKDTIKFFFPNYGILTEFLPQLRKEYLKYFGDANWKSANEKLEVYKEALEFLKFVQQLLAGSQESTVNEVVKLEIRKWLEILVNSIDMKNDNVAVLLTVLQSEDFQNQKPYVNNCVRTNGAKVVNELSLERFYELLKSSHIWNAELVQEFLDGYEVPDCIDLKDPFWKLLFDEIIFRFSGDVGCRERMYGLIVRIAQKYKDNQKQSEFIIDFLRLDVPNLLQINAKPTIEKKICEHCSNFLHSFFRKNGLGYNILAQVRSVQPDFSSKSHLQHLILSVIQKETVPAALKLTQLNSDNGLKQHMCDCVDSVSKSITSLQSISTVNKFYWEFIVGCCNNIQLKYRYLERISKFLPAIEILTKAYRKYCKKVNRISGKIPDEIEESDFVVKDYFKWINDLQGIFLSWKQLFESEKYNHDDIIYYYKHTKILEQLAKSVKAEELISETTFLQQLYLSVYDKVVDMIMIGIRGTSNRCSLIEILCIYGVKLDNSIQCTLNQYVFLGSDDMSSGDLKMVQSSLTNITHDEYSTDVKYRILLKKSMTLTILKRFLDELQIFLEPLSEFLQFLAYFHFHSCQMFSKHLKEKSLPRECILNSDVSLDQFAAALAHTREFIISLINGSAKYEEIIALETSLENFDSSEEFQIMCKFPDFDNTGENEEGRQGIKHMLELIQYLHDIAFIPKVCVLYQLEACNADSQLILLKNIVTCLNTDEGKADLTGIKANHYIKQIWRILKIDGYANKRQCLKIFPSIAKCKEFHDFIKKWGYYGEAGRLAFKSQLELVTGQLQHEDYNEDVLNQLMPAFEYISPFMDKEQSLEELMFKILRLFEDRVGFGDHRQTIFCQLETVNVNLSLIQYWFCRAEGDTLKNVGKELQCILDTGYYIFELNVQPTKLNETVHPDDDDGDDDDDSQRNFTCSSNMLLYFKPAAQQLLENNPVPLKTIQWNKKQIDDFVRKLGFLEKQDVEQTVKQFQQLNEIAQEYYNTLLKLRDLGHPDYLNEKIELPCCTIFEEAERMVSDTNNVLDEWQKTIENLHWEFRNLTFFSISKVAMLYEVITSENVLMSKLVQGIAFLFQNTRVAIDKLHNAIQSFITEHRDNIVNSEDFGSNKKPFVTVGKLLENLCKNASVAQHYLCSRNVLPCDTATVSQSQLHYVPNYNNEQLIRLLIGIYNGVPESYEVLHCSETTVEDELILFLRRASLFRKKRFTLLGVNLLHYKLQELVVHYHSSHDGATEAVTTLTYIETAVSILHEMPWVDVQLHKENGPTTDWKHAKGICSRVVNVNNANFNLYLVYGCAGDGKTHYIRKQIAETEHHVVIAVNESFSTLDTIMKLRSLTQVVNCAVYFNFTIIPLSENANHDDIKHQDELQKYRKFMDSIAWFFFKLLIYEHVEDVQTGMAFRLPGGYKWNIYIEVPSWLHVTQEISDYRKAESSLTEFLNRIPVLRLFGKTVLIENSRGYDIDGTVKLLCKYLRAYENRGKFKGINKMCRNNVRISFAGEFIRPEECEPLLKKYMPVHVKENKMLQRLFVKYMERRCVFLETFPAFIYNTGGGLPADPHLDVVELDRLVADGYLIKQENRYYTNTSNLGEVLVETMISEVSEFCRLDIQHNCSIQAHRQLIYQTAEDGGGEIRLITLKPDELDPSQKKKIKTVGVHIPTMQELETREYLDSYLSTALGTPLVNGKLPEIDEAEYVLTLDYTVKMLNIHERQKCGIPVIIEGETGVGKTALLNMLSKLWNHALRKQWKIVKGRILEKLRDKSLELEGNLQDVLAQSVIEYNVMFTENDLLPLLEMMHPSAPDSHDRIKYYVYINYYLLQLVDSDKLFKLLTFEPEKAPGEIRSFPTRIFAVKQMIDETVEENSAEATAQFICNLLNATLISTFYKLNIHAALTAEAVHKFFRPIIKLAKVLQESRNTEPTEMKDPPMITVFLDEVNTTSCIGLFKEIIVDKSLSGKTLPPNIFLVAACNPHRGDSLAVHCNAIDEKSELWVRGSYYVHKLHPTMRFLMWDYGSLNKDQELNYVKAKMVMVNDELEMFRNINFSELVIECQELVRKFAYARLLTIYNGRQHEMHHRASSCVSQRDIQRVFTFYKWIMNTYTRCTTDYYGRCFSDHPVFKDNSSLVQKKHRALLVSLGVVYYVRLDSADRKTFVEELDRFFGMEFSTVFEEEINFYISKVILPAGIAKTEALKENLFVTILCTVTNTPVIIVGAPGSSKTLSFNITIANLKGCESKQKLFRNTEIFKSMDPHYYQCSRRTTSVEIETVFQHAIKRQQSLSMPIRCVVFMDEAGLPEERHESLKALHYYLDQQEVAFVAITNHILDAAKTNRAISLFRPSVSENDLKTLAEGCLCSTDQIEDPEIIKKFCSAYSYIMKQERFKHFFGLRDFVHFINYIRRKRTTHISSQLILESLERNFNHADGFEYICEVFLGKEQPKKRNIIEILNESLADKPTEPTVKPQTGTLARLPHLPHDVQKEVRYKLIIDPSDDESISRLLFMFNILRPYNTRTYMCSDFPGDGQLLKINTIAAIRHSAVEGHTVVLMQTDDIHESFYDLFNQNFRRIDDPNSNNDPRYYANVAIGAHVKPSRVNIDFQCIVVIKQSEIDNTPAPFLDRFEKYFVSHEILLNTVVSSLPQYLRAVIEDVHTKVDSFFTVQKKTSFYGANTETVNSLLLSILPNPDHAYKKNLSPFAVEADDDHTSTLLENAVIYENLTKKAELLCILLHTLHTVCGFYLTESTKEDYEHDANNIIDLLKATNSDLSVVIDSLENCDKVTLLHWVLEALNILHTSNQDSYHDQSSDDSVISDGATLVISLLAQWLVRYLCKRLMQLMITEVVVLNRKNIPTVYLESYLNFQVHFSLKDLITKKVTLMDDNKNGKVATKWICYTRSASIIHQLPARYPSSIPSLSDNNNKDSLLIKSVIYGKVEDVMLCNFSSISSHTTFKVLLNSFKGSDKQVFILILNMQDTSKNVVNHIRIMIEEIEAENSNKLFILLLHFPPIKLYNSNPCYPSLFSRGWDFFYLDTIEQAKNSFLVDIKFWFQKSCLHSQDANPPIDSDPIPCKLQQVLKEPESIQTLASRVLISRKFNSDLDEVKKSNYMYLTKILDKGLVKILCLKFKTYWTSAVMAEHLQQAAIFSKSRESTLNISDTIHSVYKTTFFNFMAYMIYHTSKHQNFEVLLNDECDDATLDLFLQLLEVYPIPKLAEVKTLNNTWDCRHFTIGKHNYVPQFPFFKEVSGCLKNMAEQYISEANENVDTNISEDLRFEPSGFQSKEQRMKRMYEYLCDKTAVVLKERKSAEVKLMVAIGIKEMQNNENLWMKYYHDFVYHVLQLQASSKSLEYELLQVAFFNELKCFSTKKVVAAHCYVHMYQLDLARTVGLLKPLGTLLQQTKYSGISKLQTPQLSKHPQEAASYYAVEILFELMVNIINTDAISACTDWYCTFRDMVSMILFRGTILKDASKIKHCIMNVVFLILQSFPEINATAADCACEVIKYFLKQLFTDDFQVQSRKFSCNMKQTVSFCNSVFKTIVHFNKSDPETVINQYQCILEGLFVYFFPEPSDKLLAYSQADIICFLELTSIQTSQRSDERVPVIVHTEVLSWASLFQNCITVSKMKIYLNRILRVGWNMSVKKAKPLNFYKSEVWKRVGQTIFDNSPKDTTFVYTPIHHLKSTGCKTIHISSMQQTLADLYFYTVLEELAGHIQNGHSNSSVITLISDIDERSKMFENNTVESLMLHIERQAVLEVLLQELANSLDNRSKLANMTAIADQINNLVSEQCYYDVLLMHLITKYHGPRGVLKRLSEENEWCNSFTSFKSIIQELQDDSPPPSHLFPFMIDNDYTNICMSNLYKEICNRLAAITQDTTADAVEHLINYITLEEDFEGFNRKYCARMMIWLYVYHEVYLKQGMSQQQKLLDVLIENRDKLELSTEHLHVLRCFLTCEAMINIPEVPNSVNPNEDVLEYNIVDGTVKKKEVSKDVPRNDPIWEFFNVNNSFKDQSDNDLRNAMANLIAIVFGLPDQSTHIWYHMFSPYMLDDTFMTGFMYCNKIKSGTLFYDCGCEINEYGEYGRRDYKVCAETCNLDLYSWYLMLWTNFGAFSVGLLTQPDMDKYIKGCILSDWLSVRHYCLAQLRTTWLHMQINLSLGDKERSCFIMKSLYNLLELGHNRSLQGIFTSQKDVDDYQFIWHKDIYKPAIENIQNVDPIWELPVLQRNRKLDQCYPHIPTKHDFVKSMNSAREGNSNYLYVLDRFNFDQKRLRIGGVLLPDLVEFYQWIHTHLSHIVTFEKAKSINIGKVIDLSTRRYSQEECSHLKSLFERVKVNYNDYLAENGGVVSHATCQLALKATDVHRITENTPLIRLVSHEDEDTGNDWLYIVVTDIIENHNAFLQGVLDHAESLYEKYLPLNPPKLHPTEVTSHNCIPPPNEVDFMKLVHHHCLFNKAELNQLFDFDQLEQDIVTRFIVGKLQILPSSLVRNVFRFKNYSPVEGNSLECHVDLSAISQELPIMYKQPLEPKLVKKLELHFQNSTYYAISEITDGLRIVMGYLIQYKLQGWDLAPFTELGQYLKDFYKTDEQVFMKIGIKSINDKQLELLKSITMRRLFNCLKLFVEWIHCGLYDFASLPLSLRVHLDPNDVETLENIPQCYFKQSNQLLKHLEEFEKLLNHSQGYIAFNAIVKSFVVCLEKDWGLYDPKDEIHRLIDLIPKTIMIHHYVHFRMALRRLKLKVSATVQQLLSQPPSTERWSEIIENLWEGLPHIKKTSQIDRTNSFTLQYGERDESCSDTEKTWIHHDIESSSPVIVASSAMGPSGKARSMTSVDLCNWLKMKKIPEKHVKLFEDNEIDGEVLTTFSENDLEEMGIGESYIRKKILVQFSHI